MNLAFRMKKLISLLVSVLFFLSFYFLQSTIATGKEKECYDDMYFCSSPTQGNPSANDEPSTTVVQGDRAGEEEPVQESECEEQLAEDVKNATSNVDPTTPLVLSQMGSAAAQPGQGARTIYKIDAGAKLTLAAIAMKKYNECSSAIRRCRRKCKDAIEDREKKIRECDSTPDVASRKTCREPYKEAKEKYQDILNDCMAQQGICDSNRTQALMAGAGAAQSFAGARALGDKELEKDPKDTDTNPEIKVPPPSFPSPESSGGLTPNLFSSNDDGTNKFAALSPLNNKEKKGGEKNGYGGKPDDESTPSEGEGEEEEPSPNGLQGLGPLGGVGFDSRGSNSLGQGAPLSSGAASSDFIADEEWEDEEGDGEEDGGAGRRYASSPAGSFAGGSYRGSGFNSKPSYGNRGRGKKTALNAKGKKSGKKELKRNVFGKAGPHDNIFERMSKIIQSYCGKDGPRCQ